MLTQSNFTIATNGRGFTEITELINQSIECSGSGLAHVFLQHTSASLLITENADPTVLRDLETIISRLAPDGDPEYLHDYDPSVFPM